MGNSDMTWDLLDRFLIFGSTDGTYYVTPRQLSPAIVSTAIERDGVRTVRRVLELDEIGRAPRTAPAIYTLALAAKLGDAETKKTAFAAMPRICRTAAHLFQFARDVERFGGWGRATRRAFSRWYTRMPAPQLAEQSVRQRESDGWSHRDLLRLAHPRAKDEEQGAIFAWLAGVKQTLGVEPPLGATRIIWAFERAKRASSVKELVSLIREHRLPEEAIPTPWLEQPAVWEALLEDMSLVSLLRNLSRLTKIGVARAYSAQAAAIASRITDRNALRKARLHPIALLAALHAYKASARPPVPELVNALDAAFYAAIDHLVPAGKRFLVALDVSTSMRCGSVAGLPGISPLVAGTAMSLVTAATEKRAGFLAFTADGWSSGQVNVRGVGGAREVELGPRMRLDAAIDRVSRLPFGGTDCALPMLYANAQRLEVDVFVVLTDCETWAGEISPARALAEYREARGRDAKLVVVGMSSSGFAFADVDDAGMLDVVGFDATVPAVIADFARSERLS